MESLTVHGSRQSLFRSLARTGMIDKHVCGLNASMPTLLPLGRRLVPIVIRHPASLPARASSSLCLDQRRWGPTLLSVTDLLLLNNHKSPCALRQTPPPTRSAGALGRQIAKCLSHCNPPPPGCSYNVVPTATCCPCLLVLPTAPQLASLPCPPLPLIVSITSAHCWQE